MFTTEDILRIILLLIGFGAILFLTYVTTRYIAKKQIGASKSRNISILETVVLGTDKRLHLVKAGNSYVLIASTSKSVEFLTTVELDETAASETDDEESGMRFDFRSIFEKYSGIYKRSIEKKPAAKKSALSEEEKEEPIFRKNLEKLRVILDRSRTNDTGKDGVDITNDKDEERS
ncbi:MAG: flagellar biosynthetic protein FliO [Clostridiaceae bacterium]|jgi:flagellar protein FliO/FliZ|nr:flagellar biosynthetic protein FliO [Clostridiaceae bacterium]